MLGVIGLRISARAIVVVLACCALVVSPLSPLVGPARATTGAPTADAQALAAAVPAVSWKACRDGFQCATVQVPLDYDQPAGQKISLALIRMPAGNPGQRVGSLFVNPGGPGGSGVDIVRGVAQFLPLELRGRFDIVGFDPRGIIRSTPLRCFPTFEDAVSILPPFAFPVTTREENIWRASDQALAGACAQRGGPILDHMSTADVARDMDLLRQAVGDSKLTYLGYSYGSFLGQVYANLFPDKVRAVVIDGVLDPIAWTTGNAADAHLPYSTRLRSDVGAQRTLGEFFRLCDAAGGDCAFSGGASQRYADLAQRLRREPLVIEDGEFTFTTTYADLVAITLGALYRSFIWPDLAFVLADLEAQAAGTRVPAAQVRARLGVIQAGLGLDAPAQEPYPNYVEGGPGVACSDSVNPDSFAAWRQAADTSERQNGYFGPIWTWLSSACLPWPDSAGMDRYLGPWTARTSAPVLVVGNYFDPATRYQGAVTASALLTNSRLLSYAGWGHTAFLFAASFCVDSHVTRYLVTSRPPAAGTVCQPQGSPFGPLEALAQQRNQAAAVLGVPLLPESVRRTIAAIG